MLPTDVLKLSLYEFNLNVGIMSKALDEENRMAKKAQQKTGPEGGTEEAPKPIVRPWKSFGIAREVRDGRTR